MQGREQATQETPPSKGRMGCTKISSERVVRVAVPKGSDHTSLINKQRKKDFGGGESEPTIKAVSRSSPTNKKFQNNLTNKIGYVIMDI